MNGVSNTNATAGVYGLTDLSVDSAAGSLTPDTLLAFCQSRLGSLDDNIGQYMKQQQTMSAAQKQWGQVLDKCWGKDGNLYGNAVLDTAKGSPENRKYMADRANEFLEIYKNSSDTDVKAAAAAEFKLATGQDAQLFVDRGRPINEGDIAWAADNKLIAGCDGAATQKRMDSYKEKMADVSRNAELDMIKLQSLVSQRQLAVQLTTQMLQKLNEMSMAPVQKI